MNIKCNTLQIINPFLYLSRGPIYHSLPAIPSLPFSNPIQFVLKLCTRLISPIARANEAEGKGKRVQSAYLVFRSVLFRQQEITTVQGHKTTIMTHWKDSNFLYKDSIEDKQIRDD